MNLKLMCLLTILALLCSACVSRTIQQPNGLAESGQPTVKETKLIWIWYEEFGSP